MNAQDAMLMAQSSEILVSMFACMNAWISPKIDHVESKTRSLKSSHKENPSEHFRGQIFGPIFIKPVQNVNLPETLNEFESGSCEFRNFVTN